MMQFCMWSICNYSGYISHLKLRQCVNERDISSHISQIEYETERCLGYPVCPTCGPTLLSVRHKTLHHDTYIRTMFQNLSISNSILFLRISATSNAYFYSNTLSSLLVAKNLEIR